MKKITLSLASALIATSSTQAATIAATSASNDGITTDQGTAVQTTFVTDGAAPQSITYTISSLDLNGSAVSNETFVISGDHWKALFDGFSKGSWRVINGQFSVDATAAPKPIADALLGLGGFHVDLEPL